MREIKRFDAPSGAAFGQVILFEEGWLFKVQRFQEDEIPQMKVRHTSDRDRAEELFEQWKREIVEDEAVKALRGGR